VFGNTGWLRERDSRQDAKAAENAKVERRDRFIPRIDIFSSLCYIYFMTITQTIDIPADRRITVPNDVPIGKVILTFTPAQTSVKSPESTIKPQSGDGSRSEEIAARDRELFEKYADELNAEAEDVLSYQNMYIDEIDK